MPFYSGLWRDEIAPEERTRAAERLIALRAQLDKEVPARTVSETLLLATWNIREFDSRKYGGRLAESLFYIAEIISHFDLVAVQEVRGDLAALDAVQAVLGGWWKYIVTDVTLGRQGNDERLAFLYDGRKVAFGGLAGELVIPPKQKEAMPQFYRTPFLCGFRAGWTKFDLCTVHMVYGSDKPNDAARIAEIEKLAELLAEHAREEVAPQPARPQGAITAIRNTGPDNIVALGDFNIFKRDDETLKALTKHGFEIPAKIAALAGSNIGKDKFYDQIAFLVRPDRFGPALSAGVLDYYRSVFRDADAAAYAPYVTQTNAQGYEEWRTYQMSDHLVLWAEIKVDFGAEYLQRIIDRKGERPVQPDTMEEKLADVPLPLKRTRRRKGTAT
jgi:endonuclease/exonuclease/phosphatase family metal-dependent hydrolase